MDDVPVPDHFGNEGATPEADEGEAGLEMNSTGKARGSLACTNCRRQKLRCDYAEKASTGMRPICSRCSRLGKSCVAIQGMRGRKPGSKNKPKAGRTEANAVMTPTPTRNALSLDFLTHPEPQLMTQIPHADASPGIEPPETQNPLGLLAEASHTAQTPVVNARELPNGHVRPSDLVIGPSTPQLGLRLSTQVLQEGLEMVLGHSGETPSRTRPPSRNGYFTQRPQGEGKRDIGSALDPIDLHLLEEDDANRLFSDFFEHHHACAPILDEKLHTPGFCRAHSALLFTAICLTAAQTMPGQASVTYRLRKHVHFLRQEIYIRNYRSLEILQGFDVLSLWPVLHEHVDEDRSNLALAHAIAIAYELGLDKEGRNIATPGDWSLHEQREKRSRERAMISLYLWDRTSSQATGSTWMLPDTFLPPTIKNWDQHPLATIGDCKLIQHAFLRQETSFIRVALSRELVKGGDTSHIPKLLLELYHERLAVHEANMRMLYFTSCVWTLTCGLPYTTRDSGASQNLIAALQNAALEACENLVIHAASLTHAPFNLAVLVLYAALMSLKLHQAHGAPEALAPLLGLLAQVARWLEMTGNTPSHRSGSTALYGQHLMQVLRSAARPVQASTLTNFLHADAGVPPSGLNDLSAPYLNGGGINDQFLTLDWLSSALPIDVADAMSSWLPMDDVLFSDDTR